MCRQLGFGAFVLEDTSTPMYFAQSAELSTQSSGT
jgi:hypothetical protein